MELKTLKQIRQKSGFESLFWDDESPYPLRMLIQQCSSSLKERHIEMLETTREREEKFFWQEAAASNLLAFLYLITDKEEEACQQLKLTLERYPNNLNAMIGMIRVLEQQDDDSQAKEKSDQYSKLKEDSVEMVKQKNICEGEIAYACSFIGPDFYMQAVDRYVSLLLANSNGTVKDELNGYIIRWHYYLAYTYNRMLNKGHIQKLAEKLGTQDVCEIFEKISKLYVTVIESDDVFHKGKAMIDLVDTYKKCETSGKYRNLTFPYKCGPDKFVKKAMDTAPLDPHVLERGGRHYRQRARNKKDFEETVEIFDRLLELHPSRHVAWHHKGLACKALWLIVGKYDEAKLYNNWARKGNKKQVRKQKLVQQHNADTSASSSSSSASASASASAAAAAECCQNYSSVLVTHQDASRSPSGMSVDEPAKDTQEISSNSQAAPQRAPRELPTLPPRNQHELGDVPRQLKKPDFFDKLRTSNPPVKDKRSREFLEQAKECFEKAKEITKETCSPYIVDLARSLISLRLYDDAEREFKTANKLARTGAMNNNDATYFYEQWALFGHGRARQEETPDNNVVRRYRRAILSAVRARERSRMAFYKLRDLLSEQLKQDANNKAVKMEYDVLYNSAEKFSKCKEMLVEALKKDEKTRSIAWELIKLLRFRCHSHDAAISFVYLTALHEAGQLLNAGDNAAESHADESNDIKQLILDVVRQLVREGDQTNADSGQNFGQVFRWMVGTRRLSDHVELDSSSSRRTVADTGEICILAPNDSTPGVDTVLRVLRDVCSVTVVKAFVDGNCDILWGIPILEGLRAVVAISQAVIVVEDSTDTDWNKLFPVLDELMTVKEVRMCLAADEHTDCSNTEPRYAKRWQRVTIAKNCDDIQLAHELLTAMFCQLK